VPVTVSAAGTVAIAVSFEAGDVDLGSLGVDLTPMVRTVPVEVLDVHC
jgi:hypothetical protein